MIVFDRVSLKDLGDNAGADGAAAADVTWVTVAVKPESVQEVIAASRKAELYFALPAAGEGAGLDAREGSL